MITRLLAVPMAALLVLPLVLGGQGAAARSTGDGAAARSTGDGAAAHTNYNGAALRSSMVVYRARGARLPALALPCHATDLAASFNWQGAGGSLLGSLTLVNRGVAPCSVVGRPTVLLLANGTDVLPVAITVPSSLLSHFSLRSVVPLTMDPRGSTVVALQWFNWCGARPNTLSLIYALPAGGGGHLIALTPSARGSAVALPRCDDSVISSHLDVGLFQKPTS